MNEFDDGVQCTTYIVCRTLYVVHCMSYIVCLTSYVENNNNVLCTYDHIISYTVNRHIQCPMYTAVYMYIGLYTDHRVQRT